MESTDTPANRIISDVFQDSGHPWACQRYFSNDSIRYGKIKKLVVNYKSKVVEEHNFQVKSNRVIAENIIYDDQSQFTKAENKFEYNNLGNISKIEGVKVFL